MSVYTPINVARYAASGAMKMGMTFVTTFAEELKKNLDYTPSLSMGKAANSLIAVWVGPPKPKPDDWMAGA